MSDIRVILFRFQMLEAVFQNLSTSDLLNCRQVNREWNLTSLRIMRQRADIELRFGFHQGKFMRSVQYRFYEELLVNSYDPMYQYSSKSLADLVAFLKKSKHFPITRFRFDDLANFESKDMIGLLSTWGKNILSLKVCLNDPIKNTVGILSELLLDKVPNLKELEIQFRGKVPSSIQLFADANKFQLPKLEVLTVNSHYRKFRGIVENILQAASNLKNFDGNLKQEKDVPGIIGKDSIAAEDLVMLKSLNKLHCLNKLNIHMSEDLIADWGKSLSSMDLKLQSLALSFDQAVWPNEQLKSGATAIINQLLDSSKTVIRTLTIEPLRLLPELNVPKLEKLRKLDMLKVSQLTFPVSLEMAEKFPNLKELGKNRHQISYASNSKKKLHFRCTFCGT